MANSFSGDVLIQAQDPRSAAAFYAEELGFTVTAEAPHMVSVHGPSINFFIEQGPVIGPVLEVAVPDVNAAKHRLIAAGCAVIKDEPHVPRCYIRDPYGLTFNLIKAKS